MHLTISKKGERGPPSRAKCLGPATLMLLTAVVVALVAAGAAGARDSDSHLIQASAKFQRLGPYWISDDPTYAGALKALGPSSSCHIVNHTPSNAVAAW